MKRLAFIYLMIVFSGCMNSDNPKDVAENYLEALNRLDFEGAKKYGTAETAKLLDMFKSFSELMPDSAHKQTEYKITKDVIEGNKATVFYVEDGSANEEMITLVKENGKWKVAMSKENLSGMEEEEDQMEVPATSTDTTTEQ